MERPGMLQGGGTLTPLLAQRRGGGSEKSCSPLQANGMAGTAQGLPWGSLPCWIFITYADS